MCIVDSKSAGFQCANEDQPKGYFITFEKGKDLLCASSVDTEEFLKACKQHQLLEITLCSYKSPNFECTEVHGNKFSISPQDADKYFCLSTKDHRRLLERCK